MKIGIVCPYSFDEPGGVQAHILDLAHILIRRGHDVRVIGPCSAATSVPDYVVRGGSSIPIPYNGSVARLGLKPGVFKQVREFIRQGDFDILHLHEPNSPSFSMAALKVATGPIVATYHASAESSRALDLVVPILRPYLEKIRGGIAVSEMARRWQVEQLGGDPVLIPNGVDTAVYRSAKKASNPDAQVEIAFLGRLDESRKGLDILLSALPHLDREVSVTVMGGGKPRTFPGVDFLGRVSDAQKAEVLGRADIYVAPNLGGESFGIVLVEAMAAGCAVVASDLPAFAAVCNAAGEHPAGRLFPTGSVTELARVLQDLIDHPEQREQLVAAGEQRAQLYDWSTVTDRILRVYETVADGTKVRVEREED
ncbi:glycosyltransferase [Corynebacterium poyangense]|uniref:Glycosyltransferase n=1 Tax=Corynebacterium poyangense TaxID=2684405 RepID=A0A7H0SP61_9CORY|nr:glycosyltransferase family 4 protein [Corynebacterium poyangense]QNQ90336.1 glycosyltransferase [Corynebacterium poyangense]